MFAWMFDPRSELINRVVDLNPAKQGRHIAGAAYPIGVPCELEERGVKSVVLKIPMYSDEVHRLLARDLSHVNLIVDVGCTQPA